MRIRLEGVAYSYDSVKAVEGVSLELEGGKVSCLVGPNGSGKTTLLKLTASLIKPAEGVVYLDAKSISSYSRAEMARTVSFSEPHIPRAMPMRVIDFILTSRYPFHRALQYFEDEGDLRIVESISRELGIEHLLDRRLDQLSSGELQRVVIAAALAKRPKVLLLDEPSAFLDLRYRFEIMDLVKRYTREQGAVTVVALHDLHVASLYCDAVALLSNGKLVSYGTPASVFSPDIIERVYGVRVELVRVGESYVVALPLPNHAEGGSHVSERSLQTHSKGTPS